MPAGTKLANGTPRRAANADAATYEPASPQPATTSANATAIMIATNWPRLNRWPRLPVIDLCSAKDVRWPFTKSSSWLLAVVIALIATPGCDPATSKLPARGTLSARFCSHFALRRVGRHVYLGATPRYPGAMASAPITSVLPHALTQHPVEGGAACFAPGGFAAG